MYLVMTLTVRGRTGARGATTTAPLVDVAEFFNAPVGGVLLCCMMMQLAAEKG